MATAGLLIYSPTIKYQFVLDDHRFVSDPRLQESGHIWEYFTSYVWSQIPGGPASFYRPIFVVWMRLNHILCDTFPAGWHVLSIVKHLAVGGLLGLLAWQLLRDRAAALVAAGLFLLHPAHTESVAWVTVPDPLMSIGVLSSLILYLSYAGYGFARLPEAPSKPAKPGRRRKVRSNFAPMWLAGSLAAFLIGLMSKETAIILPVLIGAIAFSVLRMDTSTSTGEGVSSFIARVGAAIRATLPFLGITAVYLLLRLNALKGQLSPLTQHLSLRAITLAWPATLWFYVTVMAWPIRSRAFADPMLPSVLSAKSVLLPALAVMSAVTLTGLACAWAWKKARKELSPREATLVEIALLLGILLVALPILLALNLNALEPGNYLHGRYTYLPLSGMMLLFAVAWRVTGKGRPFLLTIAGLAAIAFTALTAKQETMWKDDLTIFTVAHEIAPNNEPVALNLSRAQVQQAFRLDEEGQCEEALTVFDHAVQQYPNDWFAWAGRGECLFKLNQLTQAEHSLRRAAELSREPRVVDQWQQLRARMGLAAIPLE